MRHTKKGFTLIELVMVIVIIGILTGIGGPLTIKLIDSFEFSLYRKNLSAGAEAALSRMSREMRRLHDEANVTTANAGTYRFVDIDGNTVQFTLSGSNLERYDGTNTDVLAANVSALVFTYFDDNLAVIATPQVSPNATDIRFIGFNLTLSSGANMIDYTSLLRLRNVKQLSDLFS